MSELSGHSAPPPPDCVAIVLAAGRGSRFEGPTHKLLAPFRGSTVFESALDAAIGAGFSHVIVVTGAAEIPPRALDRPTVTVAHNDHWHEGQASSLQRGLAEAHRLHAHSVVVGLADQPMITSEAWRAVAQSVSPIAVATYDGERGNPVKLDESVWPLVPSEGDRGARELMSLRPELVSQVACGGSAADIDTTKDLRIWT